MFPGSVALFDIKPCQKIIHVVTLTGKKREKLCLCKAYVKNKPKLLLKLPNQSNLNENQKEICYDRVHTSVRPTSSSLGL